MDPNASVSPETSASITIESEFGAVRVYRDDDANGPRLAIQDLKSGEIGHFDPLELECLVWTTHEELSAILDPARTRWSDSRSAQETTGPDDAD